MASECRLSAACSDIGRAYCPTPNACRLRCGDWKAMVRILAAGNSSGERNHCRSRQPQGKNACGNDSRGANDPPAMMRASMYRAVGRLCRARVQGAPSQRMRLRIQHWGGWHGRRPDRPKSTIPVASDPVGTIGAIVKKNIRIIKEMRGKAPGWKTATRALR